MSLKKKANSFENKLYKENDRQQGKIKPVKRLKTSELIMEKEKQKMKHKYNKILRKDRKIDSSSKKHDQKESALDIALKKESNFNEYHKKLAEEKTEAKKKFKRDPKVFTAKKRAVEEYEKKLEEKEAARVEQEKKLEEKVSALRKYKKTRKDKYRGVCSKSKSGQIYMGNQVDSLLKKIVQNNKKI